jgi:hypothetical protein
MLPVVMQDEYVYRRQVLLLIPAEYEYPNYLFSGLALLAEDSPIGFYAAIKLQNTLAVAIAIGVVYWALSQLTNRSIALVASAVFLVIPSIFQSSFYMPDMFLSAFLAASLALLLLAVNRGLGWRSWPWIAAAVFLSFALLSKPHSLFFVIGIIVFATFELIRSRRLSPVFMVVGLALTIRLVTGFFVAGPAGLNLIGLSYSQSIVGAPGRFSQQSLNATGLGGSGVTGNVIGSFAWEFLQLFAALSLLTLGLLVLLLVRAFRSAENLLISIIALSGMAAIAAFETFVSANGDDHSERILTRHLEYLAAIIIGLGIHELQKHRSLTQANVFPIVSVITASVVAGVLVLSLLPLRRVSDGALIILSNVWGGGLIIATVFLIALFWFTQTSTKSWPAISVVALLALLNFSAYVEIRNAYSTENQTDQFAQMVAAELNLVGREVFVIANAKASAELFLFYTVPESSTMSYAAPGAKVDVKSEESPRAIFFPLENVSIVTSCQAKQLGQFNYFDCGNQ